MDTLGGITKKIITKEESWSLNNGYRCDTVCPKGTIVKLLNTGVLTPVTAPADVPFGVLSVGVRTAGELATVHTQFVSITRALAKGGTIAVGALLSAAEVDSSVGTEKLMEYSANAAGQYVTAIALEGGAAGAEILVGILRTFVKTPA